MRTLAWDIDDVLNDLMRTWLDTAWRPSQPACPVRFEQLTENPPHRLLGVPLSDYLASLDAFRLSEHFLRLPPRPEVVDWFEKNGAEYHHVALTAVPLHCAPGSAAWLFRQFGRWVRSFHVIPSPRPGERLPAYDHSKEEFLRRVGGIDVLIDDNPAHVRGVESAGVRGMVFPSPWNQSQVSIAEFMDRLPPP
jgi:hypothetical protein